jgi:UDP-2-acetamido-3-amino-2,3-dideoxy-glucuronate N-acetyltransferase
MVNRRMQAKVNYLTEDSLQGKRDYRRNVAVIGAGYWGKNLIRNYYELNTLHTVCETNRELLQGFTEQYPGVSATADYGKVLEDSAIAGVVIALPAELHYGFARDALDAGKHVYVEKPLTIDLKEAEELVGLARDRDRILMVGHLLHYHPVFQRLKAMVSDGELGRIFYIYSNRLSLGKIRQEEDILWSFAPHDISMILSLCGEDPSDVYATSGVYLQDQIADVTVVHMEFPGGIKSHIFVSWLHPFKEHKLVVVGEKKMAVFNDTENWDNKLLTYSHAIAWDNGIPSPQKKEPERIAVAQIEPLKNECMHFLECIDKNIKPITDGEEGLRILRVLHRAQECLEMSDE